MNLNLLTVLSLNTEYIAHHLLCSGRISLISSHMIMFNHCLRLIASVSPSRDDFDILIFLKGRVIRLVLRSTHGNLLNYFLLTIHVCLVFFSTIYRNWFIFDLLLLNIATLIRAIS